MATVTLASLSAALGIVLIGAAPATAASSLNETRPFGETITIGSMVRIDHEGRLQVAAGRYVRVREFGGGAFYSPAAGEGAGALLGAYRARIRPTPGKGVVIPPLKSLAYVELLNDGSLCGADDAFVQMACTHTDSVRQ